MSSSFFVEEVVRAWAKQAELDLNLVISDATDANAYNAEYRIWRGGKLLFQGSMDRCSDFMRGYDAAIGVEAYPK